MPLPPPNDPCDQASEIDKGHGRREKRTLRTTTILTKTQDWKGLKQGFELVRERTIKGETTREFIYGITSLSPERANARRLLDLTRGHWKIENRLHYRRDVTLAEDASQIYCGSAPQVMAALRNTVIQLASALNAKSLAAALRTTACNISLALKLIGIPQNE